MEKIIRISGLVLLAMVAMLLSVPHFSPIAVASDKNHKELFQTSDRCFACHNRLSTSEWRRHFHWLLLAIRR